MSSEKVGEQSLMSEVGM